MLVKYLIQLSTLIYIHVGVYIGDILSQLKWLNIARIQLFKADTDNTCRSLFILFRYYLDDSYLTLTQYTFAKKCNTDRLYKYKSLNKSTVYLKR